jgi:hypothetical protein
MILTLKRNEPEDGCMIGRLFINNTNFCSTIEDEPRIKKEMHKTAIPSGRYEVVINWSNRFKMYMPLLLNVPYFEGIRIHSGNTAADTSGCILVGVFYNDETVIDSKNTFKSLMTELKKVEKKEKIFINIIGGYSKEQMTA